MKANLKPNYRVNCVLISTVKSKYM